MSTYTNTGVFKLVCTDELIVKGGSNTDVKLTVTGTALSDLTKGQVINIVNDGSNVGFQALNPVVTLNNTLNYNESISDFLISTDNQYVIYKVNGTHDLLYSVNVSTLSVVNISPTLTINGSNVVRYAISPDDAYVVYLVDEDVDGIYKLYSVPISGGTLVNLATNIGTCGVDYFSILPDSSRVIYTAQPTESTLDLFSTSITGGAITQLNNGGSVTGFSVFPDSTHVLYLGNVSGTNELYVVPSIGPSSASQQVNSTLVLNGQVFNSGISPDNGYIIYAADQNTLSIVELYSVTFDTGTSTLGTPTLISGSMTGSISEFRISTDSSYVVFSADKDTLNKYELYSTAISGGGTTKLSGTLVSGGNVLTLFDNNNFSISLDASTVVFLSDKDTDEVIELYSVPIIGGTVTKLNSALSSSQNVSSFFISNDSAYVVYLADQDTPTINEIYQVPIGGGTITKLNDTITEGGVQKFGIYPDSPICDTNARVIYRLQNAENQIELYSVPYGGGTNIKLNDILTQDGNVSFFIISTDCTKVYYLADKDADDLFQLYYSPIGGFIIGDLVAIIQSDTLTGATGVATLVGPEANISSGLTPGIIYTYSDDGKTFIPYDGTGNRPLGIATTTNSITFNIDLDSQTITESDPTMCIEGYAQCDMIKGQVAYLYNVNSNIAVLPIIPLINIDTTSVNYKLTTGYIIYLDTNLYSIDFDSGVRIQLNNALPSGRTISSYSITPDGNYVLYLTDTNILGIPELFQVPVAGGSITQLSSGGIVTKYEATLDSTRVVYIANQDVSSDYELYSVLIDGTSNVKVSSYTSPYISGSADIDNFIISSNSNIVFYTFTISGNTSAIFSRSIDGSGLQSSLTPSLSNIIDMKISEDNNYLIYINHYSTDPYELFSIDISDPLPVSTPTSIQLNLSIASDRVIDSFYISSNSQYVIYIVDKDVVNERQLFRVHIAGPSSSSLHINEGTVALDTDVKISSDNKYVIFVDTVEGNDYLSSVPIYGGSVYSIAYNVSDFDVSDNYIVYLSVSDELISTDFNNETTYMLANSVSSFQISDENVIYISNQDTASLNELYKISTSGSNNVKINSTTTSNITNYSISSHDCKRIVYSNGSLHTASFYGSGSLLTIGIVQDIVYQNKPVAVKLYGQSNSPSSSLIPGKQYTYNNTGTSLVIFDGSNGYPIGFAISKSRLFLTGGNNYLWNTVDTLGTSLNVADTVVRRDSIGGFFVSDIGANNIYPNSDDSYTLGSSSNRWSDIYLSGGVVITSDRRNKTAISPCRLSGEFINKLTPVQYHLKNSRDKRAHYGFIAQDVKNVVDQYGIDFGGFVESDSVFGLKYEEFIAPIVKTLQEQSKEIILLRDEIKNLRDILSLK